MMGDANPICDAMRRELGKDRATALRAVQKARRSMLVRCQCALQVTICGKLYARACVVICWWVAIVRSI